MKQPLCDRLPVQETGTSSAFRNWRHPLWLTSLVAASIVFSLGFACAIPLAAFAAATALSLSRRDAVLLILLVWLANQLVGFGWLNYPWTASTFAWGVALGIVAVFATVAGQWMATRPARAARSARFAATFLVAFAVLRDRVIRDLGSVARRNGNLHRGNPRPDFCDQRRSICRLARAEPSLQHPSG